MLAVNQKVIIPFYDGDNSACGYVTETWSEDKYHQAGLRVGVTTKYGHYETVKFKESDINNFVIPVNK